MQATLAVLAISSIYAVAAAVSFGFWNAPFAGIHNFSQVLIASGSAILPYALLAFAATRRRAGRIGLIVTVVSVVVAALGAVVYFGGFFQTDGEFGFAFFVLPVLELVLVLPVVALASWRHYAAIGKGT